MWKGLGEEQKSGQQQPQKEGLCNISKNNQHLYLTCSKEVESGPKRYSICVSTKCPSRYLPIAR